MKSALPVLAVQGLAKTFTIHNQGGTVLPVLGDLSFEAGKGECLALRGPSGAGKSTVLRLIYGNYKAMGGHVFVARGGDVNDMVDVCATNPRAMLALRRDTIGYVSQFLRVVPRVPTLDIVAEPLVAQGTPAADAKAYAGELLARLNIPERLWLLPPATFSGGEQQRVNIARGMIRDFPVLLLDEPTAALDRANREVVIGLINGAKKRGAAIVGIFHDEEVRDAVADRLIELTPLEVAA